MNLPAEWFGGTLSVRRLLALMEGLPPDSALIRAEQGEEAMWGLTEHLLAALLETVDATSWRSVLPHAKRGWKPPKPVQIPRPGVKRRKRRATVAEIVAGAPGTQWN